MRIDYLIFFVELIEMNLKIKLKILSAENHWLYMQKLLEKTAYTIKKPSSPRDAQVIELSAPFVNFSNFQYPSLSETNLVFFFPNYKEKKWRKICRKF
jgi:hypothetical protein